MQCICKPITRWVRGWGQVQRLVSGQGTVG